MVVAIDGKVVLKEPTKVHIDTKMGLTYEVLVSVNTSNAITAESVRLHTTQIIREDSNMLYGFISLEEKKMFDTLIKINGVGSKVALAVCSTFTPQTFAKVVASKDVAMLKKVPGIGPKSAGRMLVELADFIVDTTSSSNNLNSTDTIEAKMALESLGFKRDAIDKALNGETGTTAELVKIALKKLQRL